MHTSQTLATIIARRPYTASDVMRLTRCTPAQAALVSRVACGYRVATPAPMTHEQAFTAPERAWFRRPLGAIVLVVALALGGSARAERVASPAVATAKREIAAGKAHLKAARDADRRASKLQRNATRIAKLKAALAKAECGTCIADSATSCLCPPAGSK